MALVEAIKDLPRETLLWAEPPGLGVCLAAPRYELYNAAYWEEYRRRDDSQMGRLLTEARLAFVRRFLGGNALGQVTDIGIGGGRFILTGSFTGYDINPVAIEWLTTRNRWHDARSTRVRAMTFWDSLEHDRDWTRVLANCDEWAFISTPIYQDATDCLRSKHWKPAEHVLMYTERGLIFWMQRHGFSFVTRDDFERRLGREAIGSFAFRRRAAFETP